MLNLNKCTKTKPNPKLTLIFKTAHVCAYHCAQLRCTTQHRTSLLNNFLSDPIRVQTIIVAKMMSTEGERDLSRV